MVSAALVSGIGLAASVVLTALVLRLSRRAQLLSIPNHRSSHEHPTPTLGGIGLVIVVLVYFGWISFTTDALSWFAVAGLAVIAGVGLWDDLAPLGAAPRLLVHALAAALMVASLEVTAGFGGLWSWLPAGMLFAGLCIALVWLLNLYNFLDGIDGYAASQCLVFCLGVPLLSGGVPGWAGDGLWLLAGASLGFLAFNWPPAKLFMGDVGSGFLGLLLGFYWLYLIQIQSLTWVAGLILLAVFWFDATYTLCVRIVTGQEFTKAHRLHLYQRVAERQGHLWTTAVFLGFALVWLIPMAWLSMRYPAWQLAALLAALLPLGVACWRWQAGQLSQQQAS